ncbi:hypothetical protein [Pseudoxanthomonas kaohsiungensis]|uniref:hypothetical protein n=1 Tax=Pseudoxanthomonas kaohsiungensis TaxID=283923 RepID=UPI0035B4B502
MSQNLVSLQLSNEQLAQAEQGLAAIEQALSGLVSLSVADRRHRTKMGEKSEAFCRQALSVLEQNPQVVPPSLDLAGARADLLALDQLGPLLDRLQRLAERGRDTEMALGSDVMDVALEGYSLLKVSGRGQGLDGLRKELSARWARGGRTAAEAGKEAAPASVGT